MFFLLKLALVLASLHTPSPQQRHMPVDDGQTYESPSDCRVRVVNGRKVVNSACG